eukprot:scaffold15199_cov170-Amphora_coffeaeformis.AAC.2
MDKETDDYVAELEGRSQELRSIQHYTRTMPKCSRPRKRPRLEETGDVAVPSIPLENDVLPMPLASDAVEESVAAAEPTSSS